MWIRIRIRGNREIQKKHHKSLRPHISELLDSKDILGFVMTYHTSNLYLCMDVPSLTECSIDDLRSMEKLSEVIDYLESSCQFERPDDYLVSIKQRIIGDIQKIGIKQTQEIVSNLASTELDNAARGSYTALQILNKIIPIEKDPCRFFETILKACLPLNGSFIISKSTHFCFNSLAISPLEETAIEVNCSLYDSISATELAISKTIALESLRKLENREPGIFQACS